MLPAIRRNPTAVFLSAARRFGEVAYFQDRPAPWLPHHEPCGRPPRPAGQRAQLSQEPALRQAAHIARQRAVDERGRILAPPAAHRPAGLSSPAGRDAGRRDGRRGAECRVRMADDRLERTARRCGEEMMRLTRTVVLRALLGADLGPFTAEDRPGLDHHQRARRRELLVARAHRPAADAEVPAVQGRAGRAPGRGRLRDQPAPPQPD